MRRAALAALAALPLLVPLAPLPAAAEGRPSLFPSRDAEVTYRAEGDRPVELHVRYRGGTETLRFDDPSGAGLVDFAAGRVTILEPRLHMYMELPAGVLPVDARGLLARARFTRRGGDTVAGLACTVWDVRSDQGDGRVCVAADGLVLRASGTARGGQKGGVEAVSVTYAPQPADLFTIPADYRRLDIPAAPAKRP